MCCAWNPYLRFDFASISLKKQFFAYLDQHRSITMENCFLKWLDFFSSEWFLITRLFGNNDSIERCFVIFSLFVIRSFFYLLKLNLLIKYVPILIFFLAKY